MKINLKISLTIAFIFILSFSKAQFKESISDKLVRKTSQKVEKRVDKKIDKGIDETLDKIEGKGEHKKEKKTEEQDAKQSSSEEKTSNDISTENGTSSQPQNTSSFEVSVDKSKVKPSYHFNANILMNIESIKKNGKKEETQQMRSYFSESEEYFAGEMLIKDEKNNSTMTTVSIFDWQNNLLISLIDNPSMKMGVVMGFDAAKAVGTASDNANADQSKATLKKTGRTKKILNYNCDEYISEDEDNISEIWITNEVKLSLTKVLAGLELQQKGKKSYPTDAPQGLMMETTTTNKKKGDKTILRVVEINQNKSTSISTKEYTFY